MAALFVLGAFVPTAQSQPRACSPACVKRVKHRIQKRIRHQHRVSRTCGTPACNRRLGRHMAIRRYGISGWNCTYPIIDQESGWDERQWNTAGSGAYGIPQALPASKMSSAGADYMTNPRTQIRWMFGYFDSRYGGPCGALSHKHATGWY